MSGTKINMQIEANANSNELTFEEGFDKFIVYCKIKNLREKTIQNYRENYNRFIRYINEHTMLSNISQLNQSDIDNYVIYLYDSNMKPTSINTYLRGLRAILYFFVENDFCDSLTIHMVKTDKLTKETYSDIELFKLLTKPNIALCDFTEYRNWVIINFFIATGVRASTLIYLQNKDLDFSFDKITLTYTKNRQSYIIPMSGKLKFILNEYIKFRKGNPEDYLFCNQYGEQLTLDGLKHAVSKYNRKRGVTKTSLHLFRHTFAKRAVMNGMNVFVLQKWLGHSDISVTKEYINLYANDLALNMQSTNPLDTFMDSKSTQKEKTKTKRIRLNI